MITLPPEIQAKIIGFLDNKGMGRAACTCRQLRLAVQEARRQALAEFGSSRKIERFRRGQVVPIVESEGAIAHNEGEFLHRKGKAFEIWRDGRGTCLEVPKEWPDETGDVSFSKTWIIALVANTVYAMGRAKAQFRAFGEGEIRAAALVDSTVYAVDSEKIVAWNLEKGKNETLYQHNGEHLTIAARQGVVVTGSGLGEVKRYDLVNKSVRTHSTGFPVVNIAITAEHIFLSTRDSAIFGAEGEWFREAPFFALRRSDLSPNIGYTSRMNRGFDTTIREEASSIQGRLLPLGNVGIAAFDEEGLDEPLSIIVHLFPIGETRRIKVQKPPCFLGYHKGNIYVGDTRLSFDD